ncbi:MAG TPA: hypothetical protein DCR00_11015, partial [Gammaproteobacteria bacterium]|nr:hypothetical protein [Gammaproteobacteria bacterium]
MRILKIDVAKPCARLSAAVIASRTVLAYYYGLESSNYIKNCTNKNKANRLILLDKSPAKGRETNHDSPSNTADLSPF